MSKPLLSDYESLGFTPEQITKMYNNLTETQSLIYRLICGDKETVECAVDDAYYWLDGFMSYNKGGKLN